MVLKSALAAILIAFLIGLGGWSEVQAATSDVAENYSVDGADSIAMYWREFVSYSGAVAIKMASAVVFIVAVIFLAFTPYGFFIIGAIYVFNTSDYIGVKWACVSFILIYIVLAICFGLLFAKNGPQNEKRVAAHSARTKKKGGPLGGFHVTEAMILGEDYDDPVKRHMVRWWRDKLFP